MDAAQVECPAAANLEVALDAALRARAAAADAMRHADAAHARAKDAHAAALATLARFDDLDERIAIADAEMVKRGVTGRLHTELEAEVQQRRTAREQVERSAAALRLLAQEREAADKVHREARAQASLRAVDIVFADAHEVEDQLRATRQRMWELEDRLRGLEPMLNSILPTLPATAPLTLRAELRKLLSVVHHNEQPYVPAVHAERTRQAGARWRERHNELLK